MTSKMDKSIGFTVYAESHQQFPINTASAAWFDTITTVSVRFQCSRIRRQCFRMGHIVARNISGLFQAQRRGDGSVPLDFLNAHG